MILSQKRSNLALLAAGVAGSAAAGFGFAFGKDAYKKTKKNVFSILLILAVVFFPFLGGRNLVRGHDRGFCTTVFITLLGSVLLIVVGFCAATAVLFHIVAMGKLNSENPLPLAVIGGLIITLVGTAIGLIVGLCQRPKRLRAFAACRANEKFLSENGFRETGGTDITHYDPSGQALRFIEAHPERLVFMAVGRRGKRAYIELDQSGRMMRYSGIQ